MQATLHALAPLPRLNELNEDEVNQISGGNSVLVAGAAAYFGALNAAEAFGQRLGKALYNATR